ncbi:synaptotagmin-12 [Uranotaenia lowii]|uniref:synaptotagmin-12 n=1 Tax=Uranotaenia lowii TaxID=190385 RepID=UPI002479EAE0|nr:synaptotagmin-12 [Uranotaenia lowii]
MSYCLGSTTNEGIELLVTIQEAKQLAGPPGVDIDTFVKVFIVPDESKVLQTKVFKGSNCPSYQETFSFWITHQNVRRSLWFHVYHTSATEQTLIGECEMQINENVNRPMTTWLKLVGHSSHKRSQLGELMFSLSYLPTAERLTVVIVKARNLNLKSEAERRSSRCSSGRPSLTQRQEAVDGGSLEMGDPEDGSGMESVVPVETDSGNESIFVKVYLLKDDKKVSKKKTTVKRGERSPIYNEALIFSVPPYMLNTIQIRCSVVQMVNRGDPTIGSTNNNSSNTSINLIQFGSPGGGSNHSSNSNNNPLNTFSNDNSGNFNQSSTTGTVTRKSSIKLVSIGHVIVGSGTTGKGLRHWHQMLTTLRKPVTMWHALKTTSERKRKRLEETQSSDNG